MLSGPVAPGELITIFGEELGPLVPAVFELTPVGLFSTRIGGARVLFDGVASPLIYVSETQINAVVPYEVAGRGFVDVQVEYPGVVSEAVGMEVTDASPAIFTQNSQGSGPAAALNRDFSLNSASNPAARGSTVMLFATGEGETDRSVDGLRAAAPFPRPLLPVRVTVGGEPAEVLYAGGAPGLVAGVLQVNVRIPSGVAPGEAPVVLRVGSARSQSFVTIAVR
jgi:uncharacterized protein (TIGR03437 family)